MPTARFGSGAGVIGKTAYVVGGYNSSGVVGVNEAYDSTTKTWSTGLHGMLTPRWAFAAAVAANKLYTFGGATASTLTSQVVEAYSPATDKWMTETQMPIPTNSNSATVYNGYIYVVGGYNQSNGRLAIVQRYNPQTNKWDPASLKPMNVPKSGLGLGTTGAQIVAAEGLAGNGATPDTEGYSPAQNSWTPLKSSLNADFNVCSGAIAGLLYVAGGTTGGAAGGPALTILDIYNAAINTWTTGASMPDAVILPASAVLNGRLVCFGGSNSSFPGGSYYNYFQAYQP